MKNAASKHFGVAISAINEPADFPPIFLPTFIPDIYHVAILAQALCPLLDTKWKRKSPGPAFMLIV